MGKCETRRYDKDVETGSIRFDSIPTCDGSLEIEVARLPLRQLVSPEDCPEIPQQYHADIVYWMLYRAWSKRDADAGSEAKAESALAKFASTFGAPSTAIDEQRSEEHTSELQSLMRISYAVFCLKKKQQKTL